MNTDLLFTINGWAGNSVLDAVMRFAASVLIFGAFGVLAVLCALRLRARNYAPVVQVGTALALALVLGRIAAELFPEERPFTKHPELHQLVAHEPGQSFPSDHSLAAFGIAFAVGVFLSRRWGVVLTAVAVVVGFSRVYGAVHYPVDIAGSALIAAIAVAAVALAFRTTPVARMMPVGVRPA